MDQIRLTIAELLIDLAVWAIPETENGRKYCRFLSSYFEKI